MGFTKTNRIGVFVDVSNLYYCLMKKYNGGKLNYHKYYDSIDRNGQIVRAIAYGAQINNQANNFLDCIKDIGFTIKYKQPKEYINHDTTIDLKTLEELVLLAKKQNFDNTLLENANNTITQLKTILEIKKIRKADWDVGLTIDIIDMIDRFDTIVIGSADGDLAPTVNWAKNKGCYCVVFACNISRELKECADTVYEIDESLLVN